MKAISISNYGELLKVKNIPVPILKPNELLIKVKHAPINPADIYFSFGVYGIKPNLPVTIGMEGSGIVVDSLTDKELIGKKVAFLVKNEAVGSFSQFTISNKQNIIELKEKDELINNACLFVNPLTALGFKFIVENEKHKALIFTAANSALCKMVRKILKNKEIKTINIVRKEEQIKGIIEEGGNYVLNSSSENFENNLKNCLEEVKPTCFFDALGGKIAAKIFTLMPHHSVCYSYGALSHSPIGEIEANNFVFQDKIIQGFWLKHWIRKQTEISLNLLKSQILENDAFRPKIAKIYKLEDISGAIKEYRSNMSNGKILLDID